MSSINHAAQVAHAAGIARQEMAAVGGEVCTLRAVRMTPIYAAMTPADKQAHDDKLAAALARFEALRAAAGSAA